MRFTKTDFKKYLICPKCLWIEKNDTDKFTGGEITQFLGKLIRDGYEVEKYVQTLYPSGVYVPGNDGERVVQTKKMMGDKGTLFQATFATDEGLFVKTDMLRYDAGADAWDLYEVKSSSEIKTDLLHNHIKDITFQKIALERAGVKVGKSFIVHLNREYVREGELDLDKLFIFAEVSDMIEEERKGVEIDIAQALEFLVREEISMNGCDCLDRSHGQRCDCFSLFNPQVPVYSTAHIVRGAKLHELNDMGIFDPREIPIDFKLTAKQKELVELQRSGKPKIDYAKIKKVLGGLEFPLYFLDYETLMKPIPLLDGYHPNQQIVFQYSLHILGEDGEVRHAEYLADDLTHSTEGLVESLAKEIGEKGNVVVWHKPFERDRNKELAELHPEHKKFFQDINERIFDLKDIFAKYYLLPEFYGSASIKKVLPIMVPELSYKTLNVRDGTMAMSAWEEILGIEEGKKREELRSDLLAYCKLDTFAMLEIYRKVSEEIR